MVPQGLISESSVLTSSNLPSAQSLENWLKFVVQNCNGTVGIYMYMPINVTKSTSVMSIPNITADDYLGIEMHINIYCSFNLTHV